MKQAELFNVKDHVAFVTGAASGLGLAFAEVMAENGAKVKGDETPSLARQRGHV